MHVLQANELVLNWHITEACNFRCQYCFAAWQPASSPRELWRDQRQVEALLRSLRDTFHETNSFNPLRYQLRWRSVRLSLAGGEPTLLGDRLLAIAVVARSLGFKLSLITNGSRPDVILSVAGHMDMIGFSVDSTVPGTDAAIGRTSQGRGVSLEDVVQVVTSARAARPGIVIKINTVVNSANAAEDMSDFIARVRPDRWKIMRALPVQTDALAIDASAFEGFVHRHRAFRSLMTVEDNRDMDRTYLMVDPHGRFFQNAMGERGYRYSRPILAVGPAAALADVAFWADGFAARYVPTE
ncbi:MAG: viperin family antiviral radical SAM protein [Thermohalobaculum sp.]